MAVCIYCLAVADSSEHWLPRGLGAIQGLRLLKDRICERCNNSLGELDRELVRTGPTGVLRRAHGLRGRADHPDVSPFHYRGASADPPTIMEMPAPDGDGTILADIYRDSDGNRRARPLRQLIVRALDGRVLKIPFSPGWSADQVRLALRERDAEGSELTEIYLGEGGDPESLDLRRLLTSVFGKFHAKASYGLDDDPQLKTVRGRFGINRLYVRAIAKAGFHYFLSVSPVFRGDEPEFNALREFVRSGEGDWEDFVLPMTEQFVPQLRQGYRPGNPSHFFFAEVDPEVALARVQFFVSAEEAPAPFLVRLGWNLRGVSGRWMSAHWLTYFKEKTDGHDGEIIEFDVDDPQIAAPDSD